MESFTCSKQSYSLSLVRLITLAFFFTAKTFLAEMSQPQLDSSNDFIKRSCADTRYPDICYKTLSAYAGTIQDNPTQLASAALSVTVESAQSTSNMLLNLSKAHNLTTREAGAIKDCVENMKDSVDELKQSLLAMKDLEGPEFEMKISNVQTWVSAALTDEETCMDSFEGNAMLGEKLENAIRSYIVTVAQLTSNALALINKLC